MGLLVAGPYYKILLLRKCRLVSNCEHSSPPLCLQTSHNIYIEKTNQNAHSFRHVAIHPLIGKEPRAWTRSVSQLPYSYSHVCSWRACRLSPLNMRVALLKNCPQLHQVQLFDVAWLRPWCSARRRRVVSSDRCCHVCKGHAVRG